MASQPPRWAPVPRPTVVLQLFCQDNDQKMVLVRPNEPAMPVLRKSRTINYVIKTRLPIPTSSHDIFIGGYVFFPAINYILDCIQNRVSGRSTLEELPFCLRDINDPPSLDAVTGLHATLHGLGIHRYYIHKDIYWWLLQYTKRPISLAEFSMIAYRCHLDGGLIEHMMENQANLALDGKLPDILKIAQWCLEAGLSTQIQRTGLQVGAKRERQRARRTEVASNRTGR